MPTNDHVTNTAHLIPLNMSAPTLESQQHQHQYTTKEATLTPNDRIIVNFPLVYVLLLST
jgi:hypothetical protein